MNKYDDFYYGLGIFAVGTGMLTVNPVGMIVMMSGLMVVTWRDM